MLAWFFRSTPDFEGVENPYPLLRQRMWNFWHAVLLGAEGLLFDVTGDPRRPDVFQT